MPQEEPAHRQIFANPLLVSCYLLDLGECETPQMALDLDDGGQVSGTSCATTHVFIGSVMLAALSVILVRLNLPVPVKPSIR